MLFLTAVLFIRLYHKPLSLTSSKLPAGSHRHGIWEVERKSEPYNKLPTTRLSLKEFILISVFLYRSVCVYFWKLLGFCYLSSSNIWKFENEWIFVFVVLVVSWALLILKLSLVLFYFSGTAINQNGPPRVRNILRYPLLYPILSYSVFWEIYLILS